MTIIDLGAGPLQYATRLAKGSKTRTVAVDLDFSPSSEAMAKKHGVTIIRANGQMLPFADRSVDRILMSSLLHMVPQPEMLLTECCRVLKRNGFMVLSVPNNYQFIPSFFRDGSPGVFARIFKLPRRYDDFIAQLNQRFHVGGPHGYYSHGELTKLLEKSRFRIETHRYSPGWLGSLLWEMGVLGYYRFGNVAFHLLFFAYPLARLCDMIPEARSGSEHIVKVVPVHES